MTSLRKEKPDELDSLEGARTGSREALSSLDGDWTNASVGAGMALDGESLPWRTRRMKAFPHGALAVH